MRVSALLVSLLATAAAAASTDDSRPCGFKIAPCPEGEFCKRNDPGCALGENCAGTCVPLPTYEFCGGIANIKCKTYGETCYDDPRDKCSLDGGGADCGGICLGHLTQCFKNGAGRPCPEGTKCYDLPGDDCDPERGDKNCVQFCV